MIESFHANEEWEVGSRRTLFITLDKSFIFNPCLDAKLLRKCPRKIDGIWQIAIAIMIPPVSPLKKGFTPKRALKGSYSLRSYYLIRPDRLTLATCRQFF